MSYVDGFVCAVPMANREKYRKHAEAAAPVFKEHGALKVVECWGDDVPDGKLTSFPMAVKCKPDETGVFSWVVWPSRQVRDAGMKARQDLQGTVDEALVLIAILDALQRGAHGTLSGSTSPRSVGGKR